MINVIILTDDTDVKHVKSFAHKTDLFINQNKSFNGEKVNLIIKSIGGIPACTTNRHSDIFDKPVEMDFDKSYEEMLKPYKERLDGLKERKCSNVHSLFYGLSSFEKWLLKIRLESKTDRYVFVRIKSKEHPFPIKLFPEFILYGDDIVENDDSHDIMRCRSASIMLGNSIDRDTFNCMENEEYLLMMSNNVGHREPTLELIFRNVCDEVVDPPFLSTRNTAYQLTFLTVSPEDFNFDLLNPELLKMIDRNVTVYFCYQRSECLKACYQDEVRLPIYNSAYNLSFEYCEGKTIADILSGCDLPEAYLIIEYDVNINERSLYIKDITNHSGLFRSPHSSL